eukprot:GFUD01010346.1.p1 GENE.GFUD01010346.1~~GFUD01010346.1.p1  ORF type:complete len:164 (+),score=26.33 GFUD01010346.1:23-493(+)
MKTLGIFVILAVGKGVYTQDDILKKTKGSVSDISVWCAADILMTAQDPKCCNYEAVTQKFPNFCKSVLSGKLDSCLAAQNRTRTEQNKPVREKRQGAGCNTACYNLWYCPGVMWNQPSWYQSYEECCCHPVRLSMCGHPRLYDAECVAIGLPPVNC